tara:strand:- start:27598 stop:27750 length:153 start_codon:yes stop_codon:yes gene_type:complete
MRTIIESHEVGGIIFDGEEEYTKQLLSRLNVLERDGVGNLSATQPNKEVV